MDLEQQTHGQHAGPVLAAAPSAELHPSAVSLSHFLTDPLSLCSGLKKAFKAERVSSARSPAVFDVSSPRGQQKLLTKGCEVQGFKDVHGCRK